jgi:DNA-binding PadR family transcriptional regulator
MLSSGTVYYTLYSMERENLLVSSDLGKKRVFKATEKGLHRTRLLMDANAASSFFASIAIKCSWLRVN